jgi:hypothetical protein
MPTIKNRTLGGSCSTPAIERRRAKPACAHAIKNRTLGGSCSSPAIKGRRAKPACAHAIKNRTLGGSCSTPAIERRRAKPACAHAIKNRTLGGSCSTPAIERRRAKPACAHASHFLRPNGESRAIHGAECYSPQPLLAQCPLSTLLRSAASTSVSGGYPRSETMNRE